MTLHVRQSDRTHARPTQWTPWGAMPATREPAERGKRAEQAAARPLSPRPISMSVATRAETETAN